MHLLGLKDVSFSYTFGQGNLFEKVNLDINSGDRIGLIGPNGCGKTTLLKIILDEEKPVSGKRVLSRSNLQIGYLRQESSVNYQGSLLDYILETFPQIQKLYSEFKNFGRDLSDEDRTAEYTLLQERFESLGGWGIKVEAEKTLDGLNFTREEMALDFKLLSSGQKTKASLARILLSRPDFIVLDEPTNHLDLSSLEWLEKWLANFKETLLIVSHDRAFLDKTVNKIWDLRRGTLKEYKGNYSSYHQQREEEIERQWKEFEDKRKEVKRLKIESQRKRVWAKRKEKQRIGGGRDKGHITAVAAKLAKRAKAAEKRIEQVERVEKPFEEKRIVLDFPDLAPSGNLVLSVTDLSKAYGNKTLFADLDFSILKGENLAVTGPNGSGKTTLLKIILGEIKPDKGEAVLSHEIKIGYFDQERKGLSQEKNILEEAASSDVSGDQVWVRTVLGSLMLRKDSVYKKIKDLSEGEKGKVLIAKLILSGANFLILDEPTNHLDIDAREALENALENFPGSILFVTHDRYLIKRLADKVLVIGRKEM
ncbi:MAG TPA: ABC-F type ribosomal protection protein [Terriglobales bacterium]|nr:ABC-F type ribosomal protection protein [Terriglobales bacterium]